jgi:hypothetical protein
MICRDFPLLYSAQLDGHSVEYDQIALQRHLRECAVCRRAAAEMRSLRADLRALTAPLPSPELAGQIQKRLRQEATARAEFRSAQVPGGKIGWADIRRFWFNTFANWLEGYRAIIFSQGVGAIISLLLFFFVVTEVFEQAYRTLNQEHRTVYEEPGDNAMGSERLFKAALFPSPPPPALNPTYEFVGAAASLSDEDVILTAEVRKDGGASKVTYVVPPNDPSIQAKLSTAMSQSGIFYKPNQNKSSIAVVYLSSVTTTGRL